VWPSQTTSCTTALRYCSCSFSYFSLNLLYPSPFLFLLVSRCTLPPSVTTHLFSPSFSLRLISPPLGHRSDSHLTKLIYLNSHQTIESPPQLILKHPLSTRNLYLHSYLHLFCLRLVPWKSFSSGSSYCSQVLYIALQHFWKRWSVDQDHFNKLIAQTSSITISFLGHPFHPI
jgi:hypothetical protein